MKLAIAFAALATVAAPALASAAEVQHIKYACDGNKILDVVYVDGVAVMLQEDELVALKQDVSGSGVRYVPISEDYTYELWGKGNDMTLSTHDGGKEQVVLSNCKA